MRSPRTTTKSSPRSPQLEKACVQQRRSNEAKNKYINLFIYLLKKPQGTEQHEQYANIGSNKEYMYVYFCIEFLWRETWETHSSICLQGDKLGDCGIKRKTPFLPYTFLCISKFVPCQTIIY